MEELKRDILGYYKDKTCKLTAKPRVRFEGKEGVGSGPVREFFLCSMKIVNEGIGGTGKPIIFFEGVFHFEPSLAESGTTRYNLENPSRFHVSVFSLLTH